MSSVFSDIFGSMDPAAAAELEQIVMIVFGVLLALLLVTTLWSILAYILEAAGMYSIAKRRRIHNPWLAWVPVARIWMLGAISDHYQQMAKGKKTYRRRVVLWLTIATYVASWAGMGISLKMLFDTIIAAASGTTLPSEMFASMALLNISEFVVVALAVVLMVFLYISYHDLFISSRPNGAVAFLVLGIIFPFLLPFFVFACRKRDDGFPKVEPEQPVYVPAPQPVEQLPEPEQVTAEPVADEADFEA